ncbi:MAG: outer membrane beta-barrel protein [Saprospiraceae bacterium]
MNIKICILFCLPFMAFSQSDRFKASLLVGPSITWMTSDDKFISTESNRFGFKIHVQGEYLFNSRYSFTAGLGLSLLQGGKLGYQKGGNLWSETSLSLPKGDSLPNGVSLSYRVNYLDIPFGFKMRTVQYGKFRFYAHLPEFSIAIRTGAKGDIIGSGVASSDENIKHQILFINFGWGLGIGTEYELKDEFNLLFGVRFFQSLNDVTDNSGTYFDGSKQNSKDKINALDFRIGLVF